MASSRRTAERLSTHTDTSSPLLQAALDYAARGWPVFPCAPGGKQPLISKSRGGNGLHDAITDLIQITNWWASTPDANIGLRTGVIFDVLDIDGDEGAASIVAACEQKDWQLPTGPWSNTGGGGTHILFAPTGSGNRAGILPKVDWRGNGGYIIAPPSVHPSGLRYEWAADGGPDLALETVPAWLAEILCPPQIADRPAGPVKFLPLSAGEGTPYGLQALDRELDELARSLPGTRNDSLNAAAFNLYQLVAGGELREATVTERLRTVALSIGLPEREATTTIGSARGKGMQRPRSAPELTVIDGGRHKPTPSPHASAPDEETVEPEHKILDIITAAELVHQVETAPPVGWLVRSLFPADAHGVLAAEQKAGKTWANLDLVVSVASGTPWLDHLPVETQGPVLVFLGEGGMRKMKRRLDAICDARGLRLADLPIRFCFRVPHLTAVAHLAALSEEVEEHRPALVVIDPLYLAARGAKASQLNEMGEHLENVQRVAQSHGAALIIIHHWNKTGEGKGAKRMTGTGGAEWGRVLISMSIRTKSTDKTTRATTAILDLEFEGDEIPETEIRFRRTIWSDDPDDLAAPMHYEVDPVDRDEDDPVDSAHPGLSPAARRVLASLVAANTWQTVRDIGDTLAKTGIPLKSRTIQTALKELDAEGLAHGWGSAGKTFSWCATESTDDLGRPVHTLTEPGAK